MLADEDKVLVVLQWMVRVVKMDSLNQATNITCIDSIQVESWLQVYADTRTKVHATRGSVFVFFLFLPLPAPCPSTHSRSFIHLERCCSGTLPVSSPSTPSEVSSKLPCAELWRGGCPSCCAGIVVCPSPEAEEPDPVGPWDPCAAVNG